MYVDAGEEMVKVNAVRDDDKGPRTMRESAEDAEEKRRVWVALNGRGIGDRDEVHGIWGGKGEGRMWKKRMENDTMVFESEGKCGDGEDDDTCLSPPRKKPSRAPSTCNRRVESAAAQVDDGRSVVPRFREPALREKQISIFYLLPFLAMNEMADINPCPWDYQHCIGTEGARSKIGWDPEQKLAIGPNEPPLRVHSRCVTNPEMIPALARGSCCGMHWTQLMHLSL